MRELQETYKDDKMALQRATMELYSREKVNPASGCLPLFIQQKLNPAPTNKDQARMMAMMPLIFMIMFAHFAVGLVIYWTLSNILSVIQQRYIMYKNGVK